MKKVVLFWLTLSLTLFLLETGCASTLPCNGTTIGTKFITKEERYYSISDVCISMLGNDSARVFCRVKKEGKRVNGFLDFAVVTPADSIISQGSVKSKFPSRGGAYSKGAIGFPFEFNLSREILKGNILRLAFHKRNKVIIFQSGEKNLAL